MIPVHRLDNAIDYTLDEKKCSRRENEESLEGEIDKALNKDKTEQDLFCSAIGCTLDSAFEDMCQIKRMWHKEKGVQGFHLVQSFAAGEVTPELAHQIGQEFADRLLGGRFQVVISTHLNTGHIHNHLVWNSVSIQTGKKYRSNEKSYVTGVRRISDELCRKYHLSVIDTEKSERVARPYAQWLAEQEGKPTWKTVIQQDVDAAIAASLTWKQFLRILERQGYAFRFDRKHPTLILPGSGRTVRFKTLGMRYTPETLQRRILYPKPAHWAGKEQTPVRRRLLLSGKKPHRRRTGIRFRRRERSTKAQEAIWESTVARAAPATSRWRPKMKMGSRMMLHTAPISTVSIPVFAYPWALINAFNPSASCTKMVPSE